MLKVFLLIFLAAVTSASTVTYGNYCGHSGTSGLDPIDNLDSICQTHDICMGALSTTNCFCSGQFYEEMLSFTATSTAQQAYKNTSLAITYGTLKNCPYNIDITNTYYFAGCLIPPCPGRGLTYFPVYGYSINLVKTVDIISVSNALVYSATLDKYNTDFINIVLNTVEHLTSGNYIPVTIFGTYYLQPNQVLLFINNNPFKDSSVTITEYSYNINVLQQAAINASSVLCQNNTNTLNVFLNMYRTNNGNLNTLLGNCQQNSSNLASLLSTCQTTNQNLNQIIIANNKNITNLKNATLRTVAFILIFHDKVVVQGFTIKAILCFSNN